MEPEPSNSSSGSASADCDPRARDPADEANCDEADVTYSPGLLIAIEAEVGADPAMRGKSGREIVDEIRSRYLVRVRAIQAATLRLMAEHRPDTALFLRPLPLPPLSQSTSPPPARSPTPPSVSDFTTPGE